ncbi:MAG: hypothetical protein C0392_06695 [Syntrophus sp. (in: bacteria)]|nr:hypothetical protein [Syntrophus sp. (in: bacteria)]
MSIIQGTTTTSSATTANATTAAMKNTVSKDDFLKILVTQLKYQNPLDPQKADEFMTQLAQLSQVEQLTNINASLEKVAKGNTTSQWVSAIGKKVNVSSNTLSKGDQVLLSPQADYDKIVLGVKDLTTGTTKKVTFNKGDSLTYTNDSDNNVQIGISATKGDKQVTCNAMVLKVVKGIAMSDAGTVLVFGDNETVDTSKVTVIKE